MGSKSGDEIIRLYSRLVVPNPTYHPYLRLGQQLMGDKVARRMASGLLMRSSGTMRCEDRDRLEAHVSSVLRSEIKKFKKRYKS